MELLSTLLLMACGGISDVGLVLKKEPRVSEELIIVTTYKHDEECLLVCDDTADGCMMVGEDEEAFLVCDVVKEECYQQCPKQKIKEEVVRKDERG